MIRVHFSPEDLAEIRFAFSPTWELVMSAMKALKNPAKHALHLPWVQEARTAIDGRDLGILFALIRVAVRARLHHAAPDDPVPGARRGARCRGQHACGAGPDRARQARRRHQWPGPRARSADGRGSGGVAPQARRSDAGVLEADDRGTLAPDPSDARGGRLVPRAAARPWRGRAVVRRSPPSVAWRDGVLEIDKPHEADVIPAGSGMILIPAVFDWPGVAVIHDEAYRFTLSYSPRGIANIWGRTTEVGGNGRPDRRHARRHPADPRGPYDDLGDRHPPPPDARGGVHSSSASCVAPAWLMPTGRVRASTPRSRLTEGPARASRHIALLHSPNRRSHRLVA